jgi:SMODS-associating 4TM effector domain
MLNDIIIKQNRQKQIEQLAAQSNIYSSAKRVVIIQTTLDILTPIVSAIVLAVFPDSGTYTAFGIAFITALDVIFEINQSAQKKQAAAIQEQFDCDVLGLECQDLTQRHLPGLEAIVEAAEGYKKRHKDYSKLENWYPKIVEKLPLHLARLVCQRENCWWDAQLRRRYARLVGFVIFVLFVFVTLIGLIKGYSVGYLIYAIVAPLIPALVWAFRQLNGQLSAAKEKDDLKQYSEETWRRAIKEELTEAEIEKRSRHLQDLIYHNRSTNPFILDLFYFRLRPKNEVQMNRKAEELVEEAMQSLSKK